MIDRRFIFTDNDRRFIIEFAIYVNGKFDDILKLEYTCSSDDWEDQKNEILGYLEWKELKFNERSDIGYVYEIRLYSIYKRMGA